MKKKGKKENKDEKGYQPTNVHQWKSGEDGRQRVDGILKAKDNNLTHFTLKCTEEKMRGKRGRRKKRS